MRELVINSFRIRNWHKMLNCLIAVVPLPPPPLAANGRFNQAQKTCLQSRKREIPLSLNLNLNLNLKLVTLELPWSYFGLLLRYFLFGPSLPGVS